jgi:(p)ppGpp synthase/HD superfamily hydrolase
MSTLERAIAIAATAHAGQLDKAGQPYILHPLRVMLTLSSEEERIVGVLHDVVEDTDLSLIDLEQEGFSKVIVDAVQALTKLPGETRMEAAVRAAQNPIARRVKLADNADNMDLSRIPNPTEADFARIEEYRKVRHFLLSCFSKD